MAQLNDLIVSGAARFLNTINGKITNASTADYAINASTSTFSSNVASSSLPNSGATAGSYGMANATTGTNNTNINIPYITVDAKGRVTSISNKVYTSKDTANTDHLYYAGTGLTVASTSGNNTTFALATSGATSGTYGPTADVSGSNGTTIAIPKITIDAYGRVTSASTYKYTSVDHTYTIPVMNNATLAYNSAVKFATSGSTTYTMTLPNVTTAALPDSGATAGSYGPSADVNGTNGTTIAVPYITVDAKGRVTSITNKKYTSVNTDNDTKNTAGSTDTSSKIFLVGATSQAANPQTYSDNEVFTTSGVLTTKSVQIGGGSATLQYNANTQSIDFVFA